MSVKDAIEHEEFYNSSEAVGSAMQYAARICGQEADRAGWRLDIDRNSPRDLGSLIALTHSELSEMLETLRTKDMLPSKKLPGLTAEEDEAADVLIRHLDYCQLRGLRIGDAVAAKLRFNRTRTTRHGKTF